MQRLSINVMFVAQQVVKNFWTFERKTPQFRTQSSEWGLQSCHTQVLAWWNELSFREDLGKHKGQKTEQKNINHHVCLWNTKNVNTKTLKNRPCNMEVTYNVLDHRPSRRSFLKDRLCSCEHRGRTPGEVALKQLGFAEKTPGKRSQVSSQAVMVLISWENKQNHRMNKHKNMGHKTGWVSNQKTPIKQVHSGNETTKGHRNERIETEAFRKRQILQPAAEWSSLVRLAVECSTGCEGIETIDFSKRNKNRPWVARM